MVQSDRTAKLTVDFSSRGNSVQYCRGGWNTAEPQHTWTSGYESGLELPLPALAGAYLLNLTVAPFVWKDKLPLQKLIVTVNGQEVETNLVRERASLEYRLPWNLLNGRNSISIVFKHPDAATPVAISGVPDDRLIAFAFESVMLTRSVEQAHAAARRAIASGTVAAAEDSLPLSELALKFESLGENCEFGLVQRRLGAEALGLLRFSSTPLLKLIDALNMRFDGLGRPELVEVRVTGTEYMVLDKKWGFLYHPWVSLGDAEPKAIHERECGRLPFLVSKLIDDLEEGDKIFVYHGMRPLAESMMLRLLSALRRYSNAPLLWVEKEDADNRAGTVKELTDGFLKGYIDRFAPSENAHEISLEPWISICRNAYALSQKPRLVTQ